MKTGVFSPFEFINAASMNNAMIAAATSIGQMASGISYPGLVHPEAVSLAGSGLTINVSAPQPFQIIFGDGTNASASGIVTGQISSNYAVSFAGSVPVSGSVTAYLLASTVAIQQDPYQVVGPPPGHPDYNPSFVPYTAYNYSINSIAMSASTMAADNVSTFELARITLSAAATGVGVIDTKYQRRASAVMNGTQVIEVSGLVSLATAIYGGRIAAWTTSGIGSLPSAAASNGVVIGVTSRTSGTVTLNASGSDSIYGAVVSGASFLVSGYGTVGLLAQSGNWYVQYFSPAALGLRSAALTNDFSVTDYGLQSASFAASGGAAYVAPTGGTITLIDGNSVQQWMSLTITGSGYSTLSGYVNGSSGNSVIMPGPQTFFMRWVSGQGWT